MTPVVTKVPKATDATKIFPMDQKPTCNTIATIELDGNLRCSGFFQQACNAPTVVRNAIAETVSQALKIGTNIFRAVGVDNEFL